MWSGSLLLYMSCCWPRSSYGWEKEVKAGEICCVSRLLLVSTGEWKSLSCFYNTLKLLLWCFDSTVLRIILPALLWEILSNISSYWGGFFFFFSAFFFFLCFFCFSFWKQPVSLTRQTTCLDRHVTFAPATITFPEANFKLSYKLWSTTFSNIARLVFASIIIKVLAKWNSTPKMKLIAFHVLWNGLDRQ